MVQPSPSTSTTDMNEQTYIKAWHQYSRSMALQMCSSSRHSVKASNVPVTPHIVVAAIFCIPNLILLLSHQNLRCSASIMVIELYSFQNFIEQCWGFAKCLYHQYPASSKEINLECNVLTALESVPIIDIRWYDLISLLPYLT